MVKRQKEKQYNSAREHKAYSELRSGGGGGKSGNERRRPLPFDCCALTLLPFKTPVCNSQGIIFDSLALTEFVLQHQKDPVTGNPMTTRDIIQLQMDQVQEDDNNNRNTNNSLSDTGQWQCPVLNKVFGDHIKIIAIRDRSSSNNAAYVYSYEAYQELNIKPKSYIDLTTGHKFNPKKDVIILNDPGNDDFQKQRNISTFWHLQSQQQTSLQATTADAGGASSSSRKNQANSNVRHSVTANRIMQQLEKEKQEKKQQEEANSSNSTTATTAATSTSKLKIFSKDVTGVQYNTGKASGSFTSTVMEVTNEQDDENHISGRLATEEEILKQQFEFMKALGKRKKKLGQNGKGYVKLITNKGTILLELHCDIVPRTCTNFLGLCSDHAYDNTKFHRLIPKFMIQGGKKKKKKKKQQEQEQLETNKKKNDIDEDDDTSWWGSSFVDEFDDRLKHDTAGILSMANAGPNTNRRQFFITFQPCPHLDRKHSIFGKVTDGMDVLQQLEQIPSDKKNRPIEEISIVRTEIIVNPAQEAKEWQEKQLQQRSETRHVQQQEQVQKTNALLGRSNNKVDDSSSSSISSTTKMMTTTGTSSVVGKYLPKSVKRSLDLINDDNANSNKQQPSSVRTNQTAATLTTTTAASPGTMGDDTTSNNIPKLALSVPAPKKIKRGPPTKTTFGNFSGW